MCGEKSPGSFPRIPLRYRVFGMTHVLILLFLYNMKTIGSLLQDPKYTEKFVLQKLLCLFLGCTREELRTGVDRQVDDEMVQKIMSAYDDYVVKKKPLEYVLGHVDFFGNEFIVNEATLIPRPETEYMITAVKEYVDGKLKMGN